MKSDFPQSPLYIAALEHGCWPDGNIRKISEIYPMRRTSIADWRAVSPFLGLTEAEEIAILGSNPHSVAAQKIAMLRKWKQNHGAKANYKRLCRVFDCCKRADLVDKIKQLLAESKSSWCRLRESE